MADELDFGIEQYKAGNKDEARRIFLKVIKEHPHYTKAYQWLYNVAYNDFERENILKKILEINPTHERALELYKELKKKKPSLPSKPPQLRRVQPVQVEKPKKNNNLLIGVIALLSLIFCLCVASYGIGEWISPTINTPEEYAIEYDGSLEVYREILSSNDCAALQKHFDTAYENNQASQPGTIYSKRSIGFMTAADQRMKEIGCYK